MSAVGSGYDLSCATYGPDGKIFQIDYALKAVEGFGLGVGIRAADSVVLAVQKPSGNPFEIDSNPRIFQVEDHALVMVVGMLPDGRHLVAKCVEAANGYRANYGRPIPTHVLADTISGYMQLYTHYSNVRPFGCSLLIAGVDSVGSAGAAGASPDTPAGASAGASSSAPSSAPAGAAGSAASAAAPAAQPAKKLSLFQLDPSGDVTACFASAIGKRSSTARVELDKLMGERELEAGDRFSHLRKSHNDGGAFTRMPEAAAASCCAQVMWASYDDLQDRPFRIEFGSLTPAGARVYPAEEAAGISTAAQAVVRGRDAADGAADAVAEAAGAPGAAN